MGHLSQCRRAVMVPKHVRSGLLEKEDNGPFYNKETIVALLFALQLLLPSLYLMSTRMN